MAESPRFSLNLGIAIGPILFVIAILALLAAAIAAGSGSFTSGTSTEKAKLMATAILEQSSNLDNAMNLLRGRGYDDTQISFEVTPGIYMDSTAQDWGQSPSGAYGAYHIAACKDGDACWVYKPAGGGAMPQLLPSDAVDAPGMINWGCPSPGTDIACRAPYPILVTAHPTP